jgi:hypothetical protein
MHNTSDWQRLTDYLASYGNSIHMSDRYYARVCNIDVKTVRIFKQQYRDEKKGQPALFFSIHDEINRLQSIPRCPLCSVPLSEAETCEISSFNGDIFEHPQTVHRACIEAHDELMRWKIDLLRKMTAKYTADNTALV